MEHSGRDDRRAVPQNSLLGKLARLTPAGVLNRLSSISLQCFFAVAEALGAMRMGGAPEGEVAGWGFFACFGFLTSRLLRI